jgi:hypothetical protein
VVFGLGLWYVWVSRCVSYVGVRLYWYKEDQVVIQTRRNSHYSLFGVFNGIDRNGSLLLLYFILVLPTGFVYGFI